MNITMDGKYQTRDGRAVRILCVDGPGDEPVIGIVEGEEGPDTWTANGEWFKGYQRGDWNLEPVPVKHEGWGVVSKEGNMLSAFFDKDAWYRASIRQDVFSGDKVVCLTWEG